MEQLKILIVEDDRIMARGLLEQLQDFGYQNIDCCHDGEEALETYKREQPSLVLIDIHLGETGMDGIELAQRIRALRPAPVIFLTSYSDAGTRERAKAADPSAYLLKPCTPAQLDITIDMALSVFFKRSQPERTPSPTKKNVACPLFSADGYFFIKSVDNTYKRLHVRDILWVEAEGSSVKIITETNAHLFSANLKSFCRQVRHPSVIRVHRSYAVNLDNVQALDDATLFLEYREKLSPIPVSPSYRQEVMAKFRKLHTK